MKILAIDDEQLTRDFIQQVLESDHQVYLCADGKSGIEYARSHEPDLIILDVKMPSPNGYEVCRMLKQDPQTADIPVMFLSAHTELEEQLQGFAAGGTDYLIKPCAPDTLRAKVKIMHRYCMEQLHLKQTCREANKTAHLALLGSSEIGLAMHFMESSYMLYGMDELAETFFNMTNKLELVCAMTFFGPNQQPRSYFSDNKSSPLEIELLDKMRNQKRIFEYGQRIFVNFPNVTLLVKNMPVDDHDRYGRIKDLLPMALTAMSNKLLSMLTEKTIHDQFNELTSSFAEIKSDLLSLSNSMAYNRDVSTKVLRDMVGEIGDLLPKLGLEEDQESYIFDCIEQSTIKSLDLNDSLETMNRTFHRIAEKLQLLLDKQKIMVNEIDAHSGINKQSGSQPVKDIELF
ncbi:MAG: response regulator [Gammaproteobacteria bacterium]|nr:response regulator [Gammaproteobacteria bacterium]MDH5650588.1 response regulator [Gammaproteobacteria bacterium]